jgi:hypothetical protein
MIYPFWFMGAGPVWPCTDVVKQKELGDASRIFKDFVNRVSRSEDTKDTKDTILY